MVLTTVNFYYLHLCSDLYCSAILFFKVLREVQSKLSKPYIYSTYKIITYTYIFIVLNVTMYFCKHCNKEIAEIDDASVHDCFIGKAVFIEENSNVLFYHSEDERKYNKKMDCPFYSAHMYYNHLFYK